MMFRKFIPYCHATSIYEVEPYFFKTLGIKTLFIDLDNTLDSYKATNAKQHTIDYLQKIRSLGIEPVIISNNKEKRVKLFADSAKVCFVSSARKPFGNKLKKEIEKRGLSKEDVMLVGDQLMTDVLAAHFAKIKVMLTEKIVKEDQFTTHFNRLIDKPIRKYHLKKCNLKDWRDIYGTH